MQAALLGKTFQMGNLCMPKQGKGVESSTSINQQSEKVEVVTFLVIQTDVILFQRLH